MLTSWLEMIGILEGVGLEGIFGNWSWRVGGEFDYYTETLELEYKKRGKGGVTSN